MISDNNTLLIDARYSDLYNKEHIPSAISLPFNKFFDVYKQYKISDRNKNLIIYCNNALCNQARYVAYEFIKKGMNNVYVLEGGFQQWKSQELKKY
jgi:rhodanese-related sulfurtransferase